MNVDKECAAALERINLRISRRYHEALNIQFHYAQMWRVKNSIHTSAARPQ